jgi:cytochrome c oxidase assembly factor CtaG
MVSVPIGMAREVLASDLTAPATVLRSWSFDPSVVAVLVGLGGLYHWGVRSARTRRGRHRISNRRVLLFFGGLTVTYLALQSPIETYSGYLFSVHMVQHLLLTMVAAPLLVLGTPVTLALEASSDPARRRLMLPILRSRTVTLLSHPLVAWTLFTATMWGSHFTGLYEATLVSSPVHALEHSAYLFTAVLFWWPVVGLDPSPARISHPARLLYLFLAMSQMAFLGLAIYSSDHVLYPHYVRATLAVGSSPLADQHLAGVLMWTTGMFLIVPAMAFVLMDWMKRDERDAARMDAVLERAAPRRATAAPMEAGAAPPD